MISTFYGTDINDIYYIYIIYGYFWLPGCKSTKVSYVFVPSSTNLEIATELLNLVPPYIGRNPHQLFGW